MVVEESQLLMCNICGFKVIADQAKQHASTPLHESHKSGLERELHAVRKEYYQNDNSVVVTWESCSE